MVDITKLSALAELSRTTILAYLQYLDRAKLIHLLYSDNDSIKKDVYKRQLPFSSFGKEENGVTIVYYCLVHS